MRLLHVISTANPLSGGPIEGIIRQDAAVRDTAIREIACLDPPDAPFLRDFPIKVHALGNRPVRFSRDVSPWRRYSFNAALVPWLRAHASGYDAVIVNGLWNYATFAAARTLPGLGVPYFVFTHGMMDPWFRRTYPSKHVAKQLLWLISEGRLLHHARAVLFTTEEERRLANGEFLGWSYREAVVGYGTAAPPPRSHAQDEAFRAAVPTLKERPYLLFLSRIHEKKGVDLLVSAFARFAAAKPDLDLVIAGPDEGGLVANLKAQAEATGIAARIHWPGMLKDNAKWGALYGAEAFILPSHQENFGIAVAESLACSTPVLISNKVNIWREIEADRAGFVADDTEAGTSLLIERFLATPSTGRAALRISAQVCFSRRFDVQSTARQALQTIERLT